MSSNKQHWDNIFKTTNDTTLGWYEKENTQTFKFLELIKNISNPTIFITGIGTSNIAQKLLEKEYHLILNDISQKALDTLQNRLQTKNTTFLCHDISLEIKQDIPKSDIWFDRAVLHFLQEEQQILNYFNNVQQNLKKDGYALFAEFAKDGACSCAGLPTHRYDVEELSKRLGNNFSLIKEENYVYTTPSNESKKYIYALFKKIN